MGCKYAKSNPKLFVEHLNRNQRLASHILMTETNDIRSRGIAINT